MTVSPNSRLLVNLCKNADPVRKRQNEEVRTNKKWRKNIVVSDKKDGLFRLLGNKTEQMH